MGEYMKISEKQIFHLMSIAKQSLDFIGDDVPNYKQFIIELLSDIEIQQSDELKEID